MKQYSPTVTENFFRNISSTYVLSILLFVSCAKGESDSQYLTAQPIKPLLTISVPNGDGQVVFSPDEKEVMAAIWHIPIQLWDTKTGVVIKAFSTKAENAPPIAFAPNGLSFTSGPGESGSGPILWNVTTGLPIRIFQKASAVFRFSPDGNNLASTNKYDIVLIDIKTGANLRSYKGAAQPIYDISFSRNGTTILGGTADGELLLWNVADGHLMKTFGGIDSPVYAVRIANDGKTFYSFSADENVRLWDFNGKVQRTFSTAGEQGQTRSSFAFTADMSLAAVGFCDGTITLWKLDGVKIPFPSVPNAGTRGLTIRLHEKSITSLAFSPTGTKLVSLSNDNTVKLWDVAKLLSRSD